MAPALDSLSYETLQSTTSAECGFDTEPTFEHPLLDQGKQQIRLFKLHKPESAADGHITGELRTFDLQSAPSYHALSYTWGRQATDYSIRANDNPFGIGYNLFLFLREFQHCSGGSECWLWIDQICIDQKSTRERNHQVNMMAKIYSTAIETIIWLSEDANAVASNTSQNKRQLTLSVAATTFTSELRNGDLAKSVGWWSDISARRRRKQCLTTIMRNRYFTRLWVVQEIVLAKKIRIFIQGCVWVNWVHFVEACRQYFDRKSVAALLVYGGRQIGNDQGLFFCIDRFASTECQDPRDKVYGLMAMVRDEERIVADYGKPAPYILLDVLRVWIRMGCPEHYLKTLQQLGVNMKMETAQSNGWNNFIRSLNKEQSITNRRRSPASDKKSTLETPGITIEAVGYENLAPCFAWSTTHQVSSVYMGCWWYKVRNLVFCFQCRISYDRDPVAYHTEFYGPQCFYGEEVCKVLVLPIQPPDNTTQYLGGSYLQHRYV